jgi:hypothetical protein
MARVEDASSARARAGTGPGRTRQSGGAARRPRVSAIPQLAEPRPPVGGIEVFGRTGEPGALSRLCPPLQPTAARMTWPPSRGSVSSAPQTASLRRRRRSTPPRGECLPSVSRISRTACRLPPSAPDAEQVVVCVCPSMTSPWTSETFVRQVRPHEVISGHRVGVSIMRQHYFGQFARRRLIAGPFQRNLVMNRPGVRPGVLGSAEDARQR